MSEAAQVQLLCQADGTHPGINPCHSPRETRTDMLLGATHIPNHSAVRQARRVELKSKLSGLFCTEARHTNPRVGRICKRGLSHLAPDRALLTPTLLVALRCFRRGVDNYCGTARKF
jgi:hypothetical protein